MTSILVKARRGSKSSLSCYDGESYELDGGKSGIYSCSRCISKNQIPEADLQIHLFSLKTGIYLKILYFNKD